jgi:hypothetical protein
MRRLDRLLLNPNVQRLGGIQALAGAFVLAWGIVTGINPLIVVGGFLCVANLAIALLAFLPRTKRALAAGVGAPPEESKGGLGPEERRKIMDDLIYPPADPRRELGEQCERFAMKVRVFIEGEEEARVANIASVVRELLDASPGLDHEQASKDAQEFVDRKMEKRYQLTFGDEGRRLFDDAREQGAIAAKGRRTVERSHAFDMAEVPNMFRVIARRLGVNAPEPERAPAPPPLATTLDDMIREGMGLRQELDVLPTDVVNAADRRPVSQ